MRTDSERDVLGGQRFQRRFGNKVLAVLEHPACEPAHRNASAFRSVARSWKVTVTIPTLYRLI